MRLLGAFFNIFLFYYFLAFCGTPADQISGLTEGLEAQPVQAIQQGSESWAPPFIQEDTCDSCHPSFFFMNEEV